MSNPTTPRFQYFDSDGNPLSGGYLYSFEAGTLIALSCYSDAELTTPLNNPQVLDANGELERFYMLDQLYKFRLTEAGGMVICTPSGTTITSYASPRLDPATVTTSTPVGMEPPWGDKITINGIINDGAEASIIT